MMNAMQLAQISHYLENSGINEASVAALRTQFSGCHFTFCMDDDIVAAKPVLQRPSFNLYLVDSRNHCSTLTQDFATASGVVIAETIAE